MKIPEVSPAGRILIRQPRYNSRSFLKVKKTFQTPFLPPPPLCFWLQAVSFFVKSLNWYVEKKHSDDFVDFFWKPLLPIFQLNYQSDFLDSLNILSEFQNWSLYNIKMSQPESNFCLDNFQDVIL